MTKRSRNSLPALALPGLLTLVALLASVLSAHAAGGSGPQLSVDLGGDGQRVSTTVELLILFTLLSLAPSIVIGLTAFVRIAIVLGFLRQAVGTPQMPPNQVVISLALFLTFFVMMPTMRLVNEQGVQPYVEDRIGAMEALDKGFQPLREFMLRQTREKDLALFLDISGGPRPATSQEISPEVVIPAFLVSELKSAFQIGFMIFVPFLVLDMVIAAVLTSMGMMMLPPALISLPFKLMIFVLADGWDLLASALVRSFR